MIAMREKIHIGNIVLALYFLLAPFEDILNFGPGTVLKYIALIYIIFSSIYLFRNRVKIKKNDSMIWFIIIMMLICSSSVVWSINPLVSFKRNVAYLLLMGFFLVTYIVNCNKREFIMIEISIIAGGVALALYMLIFNRELLFNEYGRAVLTEGGGPNGLAAFMVLPLFVTLGKVFESKHIKKMIYSLFTGLLFFLILMTGSRGALLGLVFACAIWLLKNFRKDNRIQLLYFLGLTGAMLYFVFPLLPESIVLRLFSLDSFTRDFNQILSRSTIWKDTIRYIIPNSPLLGYGSGCAPEILYNIRGYYMGTHNTYLNMLVEYGIVFLPIFMLFLKGIYKNISYQRNISKTMVFSAILVIIFFLDSFAFKSLWNVLIYCILGNRANLKPEVKNNYELDSIQRQK